MTRLTTEQARERVAAALQAAGATPAMATAFHAYRQARSQRARMA